MQKYGLTTESYEALLKDCSDKAQKISDVDWNDIVEKYNLNVHYDTLRKSSQFITGGSFVSEYFKWKESQRKTDDKEDLYFKELQVQKDTIYKEKRKLYDQRREYNKILTSDARSEHLIEEMIRAANALNESRPLVVEEKWIAPNTKKEAVLFFSDWHYGMVTDNIWNTYNTDICRERVAKIVSYTKEYLQLNKIDMLNVVTLGDLAHGGCHVTCRIKSEEDVCDQIMNVSEIMAQAINELSTVVNHITVYSCYGNHLRTIQNKKESIDSDNLEKMIPWWLRQRLQNNVKVNIVDSEYKEFTRLDILGYKMCCVHGNMDNFKNIGTTVNTIFSRKLGETIDYTVSGDKHHLEEFEQYDIESVLIRSLCGTDDYANEHRLYSKAGQTLMIFNNQYGREATYHIPLN